MTQSSLNQVESLQGQSGSEFSLHVALIEIQDFDPILVRSKIADHRARRWIALVPEEAATSDLQALYAMGATAVFPNSIDEKYLKLFVQSLDPYWHSSTFGLTPTETKIFHILQLAGMGGLSRQQIFERTWGQTHVHQKSLDVHLFNIRRKLEPHRIRIVHAKGRYHLDDCR